MYVVFIHGPAASGKHTIGSHLSDLTGLPLFHNHFAVDAAISLFAFGTPQFNRMRALIWRTGFAEAAASNQSFIFTFHPESSVDPGLIEELCNVVTTNNGKVHFVQLICSRETVLQRLGNSSRSKFGKMTDPDLYLSIERQGGFIFPSLPEPLLVIDTNQVMPDAAAEKIVEALRTA